MAFWNNSKNEEETPWKESYDNWSDSGSEKKQDFINAEGEWYPLNSSNVDAVKYNKKQKRLIVRFKGGDTYWYSDPQEKHHINIMSSASPGRYIWNLRTNGVTYGKL